MRSHGGVHIGRRRRDECGKIQDSSRVLGLHHVQYILHLRLRVVPRRRRPRRRLVALYEN